MSPASSAALATEPLVRPGRRRQPERHLTPVPRPRRRPRLVYALIAVAGALAIAGAQMALSLATTADSFALAQLQREKRELTWQTQELYDDVAGLSSPQYLAANAASLGMVINASPTYLRLSDGAIIGTGEAASTGSTVDAINRGAVPNALVTDTPLVTDPKATIQGAPVEETDTTGANLPPALTDGLPTPDTR